MSTKKLLLLLIVHFSFLIINCFSQPQYQFNHYTTEDGLSQSSVFSIVQDEVGFMWFATEDGLNKFDGNKFTVYRPIENDSTSLVDLGIRKIYKDRTNKLWVLSLRGNLCGYNPIKDNYKRYVFSSSSSTGRIKIINITEDSRNNLIAVTGKGEFFYYDKLKDQFIYRSINNEFNDRIGSYHIQCILGASDGNLWIGAWEGLIRFNPEKADYEFFNSDGKDGKSIAGDMVFNLAEDNKGNIYAVSANGGLSIYQKSEGRIKTFKYNSSDKNTICSNRLMSINIDKAGKVWIGTFDKGLIYFDPVNETFTNIYHDPSVSSSLSIGAVMSIYEDRSGGLWFGNGGGGINRFDPKNQNFTHFQYIPGKTNSISPNPVLSICEDSEGNLFIGSDGGGLNIKEKNSEVFHTFLLNPLYGSNAITAIYEDSKGNIWIGSDPGANSPAGALIRYDKKLKTFTHIKDLDIKIGGISSIIEDKFGEFWITTPSDGLHRYNPKTKKEIVYRHNPADSTSISSNSLFSICEDSYGYLWIGSIASGLIQYDRKSNSFIHFINNKDDFKSIGSNAVWCVREDLNKNIWVGTWGGGINRFNRGDKSFTRFTVDNGLPGNVVYGIIPDAESNLWLSSNKGLSKFNPSTGVIRNFDRSNGLLINDFSAGALFKSTDGKFYFGGNSGLVSFNPHKIQQNTFIPKVVITDFLIFDKHFKPVNSILFTKQIELDYDENFLTIEFASLDFTAPEKNRFQYMLQGVDKNWVNSEGRNFASYTDLKNGEYIFRLKGSNSSGKFNEEETVLSIIINPPFWKTWWFRFLGIVALLLLLYSAHKYRLNKLLEVERTRIRIARDLHDEVSASITGIVYFADAVKNEIKKEETPAADKLIGLISESALQIQESISDIIWSINPDNDEWSLVLPKIRRYVSDLCESKGIDYEIDISENFPLKSLKMEQRHDLWLMFKEIITNAVKHSSCSKLKVIFNTENDVIDLVISDNGIGFDTEALNRNSGLKNIKSRISSLNGKWELISSPGNGTTWKVMIPLIKNKSMRISDGKK